MTDQLNEGPVTAIGGAIGALTRLKHNVGRFSNGNKMYLAYKGWAKAPSRITDLGVVEDFAKKLGIPATVIRATALEWKKKFQITDDQVNGSVGASAKPATPKNGATPTPPEKAKISERQIIEFFKLLHTNVQAEINDDINDNEFKDSFDSDMSKILEAGTKMGLKPEKIRAVAQSKEFDEIKSSSAAMEQLAIIGFLALRY